MSSQMSLLRPLGYQRSKSCGYCKTSEGSSSYYLQCEDMTVEHYQEIMNRGWRRAGKQFYKPDLSRACCPHYTIRLCADQFKANREQRRAMHRLNNHVLGPEYKRKAAMLCPVSRQTKRQKRDHFDLTEATTNAEYANVKRPSTRKFGAPIEPAHKLEVKLEPDSFTKEKYEVFLRYQKQIHKDPASRWPESAMKRFLCSGLGRATKNIAGKTRKLGSYHQCYVLDGKLVAVGVLDLLPSAVSSVYLFYDPDYSHFDWGKISALREIALAKDGGYDYYYMGYYIHSCVKMRYKGKYQPTFVLDPESYEWNPLDETLRQRLDQRKYVSPSHDLQNPSEAIKKGGASHTSTHAETNKEDPTADTTKTRAARFADDEDLELDQEDSDNDDGELPEGSMFDYNIPGVLSRDEVSQLDLAHWKLLVRQSLIDFEDLRGWEDWAVDDPGSIKGIAAELIAATGPKLLQNSALLLF